MVLIDEFFGARTPIKTMGEGVPGGQTKQSKPRISATPDLGAFWRNLATTRTPAQTPLLTRSSPG